MAFDASFQGRVTCASIVKQVEGTNGPVFRKWSVKRREDMFDKVTKGKMLNAVISMSTKKTSLGVRIVFK